jgi:hypothetical protein
MSDRKSKSATQPPTDKLLSSYFKLHRRYSRSINLERDLDRVEAVRGYVPTERSADALRRILSAVDNPDAHRVWSLTGVYGTGKSAFVHYLLALCAPAKSKLRKEAIAIAHSAFPEDSPEWQAISQHVPSRGLFRAAGVGRREPLSCTIARALVQGADSFWKRQQPPEEIVRTLTDWDVELQERTPAITDQDVLLLLNALIREVDTSVLIVIDELGKNLEYATQHQGLADLYLLQQIAELADKGKHRISFLGILHQSFAGYGDRLSAVEQSEWNKVQGRFEDLLFTESSNQMTRLIGQAIDRHEADPVLSIVQRNAEYWHQALQDLLADQEVSAQILENAYPLHPITALVLPQLCIRYAQNDRSLFTFLTSDEPYAFHEFLNGARVDGDRIPTLKLHQVYDYFVESVGGLASRTNLQRWVEVQSLIQDARDQRPEVVQVLKTIGILNLVTSTGNLRASSKLVALALCDDPQDQTQIKHWQTVIQALLKKGLITHRRQLDELKIWEGSDFNVEAAIQEKLEATHRPLAELLTETHPLKPVVAQRHYTTTGTLRYFEQRYCDRQLDLNTVQCSQDGFDGLILYWLDTHPPAAVPAQTQDGKPLILVRTTQLDLLRTRTQELQALHEIQKSTPELQADGVARKEVKHRRVEAERLLDETLAQAFAHGATHCQYWVTGEPTTIAHTRAFQAMLSAVCDRTYHRSPILDNELINRRELTSQGAKARRELIEAMLERGDQPRLGLQGYGPEVAMYFSVLEASGIHRQEGEEWGFYPPEIPPQPPLGKGGSNEKPAPGKGGSNEKPAPGKGGSYRVDLRTVWEAIASFCLEAREQQRSVQELYQLLAQPPYGVKPGVIPVVLAAVWLDHMDDVGIYKDGIFVPVLGSEHFELLVKDPARFSVKYFGLLGIRAEIFRELETKLRSPNAKAPEGVRNVSLLMVAKPLFNFVKQLPKYTLNTQRLSSKALQVLKTLQHPHQEPDELLFVALPEACGFQSMSPGELEDETVAATFCKALVQCLYEIQNAYETLLNECQTRLYEAFGVRKQEVSLREDLRVRSSHLVGQCIEPLLNRFILAATDKEPSDQAWLEALVMIVADKPPQSWRDEDITQFELTLSDVVRRFVSLEALQKEVSARGKGFAAQRITITEQDGQQLHEVVWFDEEDEPIVTRKVQKILEELADLDSARLQKAVLARVNQQILTREIKSSLPDRSKSRKLDKKRVRKKM